MNGNVVMYDVLVGKILVVGGVQYYNDVVVINVIYIVIFFFDLFIMLQVQELKGMKYF